MEVLRAGSGVDVDVDVEVVVGGRRWRVDLFVPAFGLYIDLDPARWHNGHQGRDGRKVTALSELDYVRVRPQELEEVGGQVCRVPGTESGVDAVLWATAIGVWMKQRKLPWKRPSSLRVATALADAARTWNDFQSGKPRTSALDAAPHLKNEFVENLTRPGIGLDWLTPHAPDRVRWKCAHCAWAWEAVVGSRAGQETGCPKCVSKRLAQERSLARAECSLAALHPELAAEFVACVTHPDRTAAQLRPSSNFLVTWRCSACGHTWETSPGARLRGRGCPPCARERIRRSRTIASPDNCLLTVDPALADEFVACLDEPGRTPADLLPKSNKTCRWRCAACGHQWHAQIATRSSGYGCPPCGRTRTSAARASAPAGKNLADLFPQLALEAVENLDRPDRPPHTLRPGSHNRCQWRCATCSHSWVTSVKNRALHGTRCPACARAHRIPPSQR
ncbi:zinc-ribbon domain-containing protein [Streptomyces sp. NPDC057939]|uniref:zinc-ribbon domain-containing protein n=1 Tax=Streptomyces sp. NPDC057939 TaxID=3346284 RepID=UPI0036E0CD5C